MASLVVRLGRVVVVFHDFATDEAFERQRGQHIQAEAEAGDVDEEVVGGEVVEDVALCQIAKGEEAGESHGEAGEHGDCGGVVRYAGEAVNRWFLEGAVDEQAVVIWVSGFSSHCLALFCLVFWAVVVMMQVWWMLRTADKGKGDDAYGLEHARVDEERAADATAQLRGSLCAFYNDGEDDDEHADEC